MVPRLNSRRWQRAVELAEGWVADGVTTAISCLTGSLEGPAASFNLPFTWWHPSPSPLWRWG
jgi:hypothetical protein